MIRHEGAGFWGGGERLIYKWFGQSWLGGIEIFDVAVTGGTTCVRTARIRMFWPETANVLLWRPCKCDRFGGGFRPTSSDLPLRSALREGAAVSAAGQPDLREKVAVAIAMEDQRRNVTGSFAVKRNADNEHSPLGIDAPKQHCR